MAQLADPRAPGDELVAGPQEPRRGHAHPRLVAGGLLTAVGWRWVFFAPVIMATAILAAAVVLVPADRPRRPGGRLDLAGALSITGAMLLLAYGVVRLEDPVGGAAGTVAVLVAGLALVVVFVLVE